MSDFDESDLGHPAVPPYVLSWYAIHGREDQKFQVATNPNLSADVALILATTGSSSVRNALGHNVSTPSESIARLLEENGADLKILRGHPRAPIASKMQVTLGHLTRHSLEAFFEEVCASEQERDLVIQARSQHISRSKTLGSIWADARSTVGSRAVSSDTVSIEKLRDSREGQAVGGLDDLADKSEAFVPSGGSMIINGRLDSDLRIGVRAEVEVTSSGNCSRSVTLEHDARLKVYGVVSGPISAPRGVVIAYPGAVVHGRVVSPDGQLVSGEQPVSTVLTSSSPGFLLAGSGLNWDVVN